MRLSPEQIAYTIDHAGSSTLLVNDEFVDLVQFILPRLPKVKRLVVDTDRKAPVTGKLEFAGEYEKLLTAASPDFDFPEFDENVQGTTFYTTGTTGQPKGVYYSHRQLVLHAISELAMFGIAPKQGRFHRDDVYMPITPMFHVHAWGFPVGGDARRRQAGLPWPLRSGAARQADQDGRRDLHSWRADTSANAPQRSREGQCRSRRPEDGGRWLGAPPRRSPSRRWSAALMCSLGYGMSETGPLLTVAHSSRATSPATQIGRSNCAPGPDAPARWSICASSTPI